jgi:cobalt/nickel transport system ATP-binding protein
MSPDILVLDEPTSSLDPRSRRRLIELLKTFEHTKIIATHDLDMALELCERTIVLHGGCVTADASTQEILQDEAFLHANSLEKPLCMQKISLWDPNKIPHHTHHHSDYTHKK